MNWRLFEWEQGDWRNPAASLWTGKHKNYTARIVYANNTQYTWELDWPTGGLKYNNKFDNATTAMLSADIWLVDHLKAMEPE